MVLSEEKINTNFLTFINYLKKYECYSETMVAEMGEKLKNGSYTTEEQYGGCYKGSLIDVTLNILCKYGFMLNENVFGRNGNQTGGISDSLMYVNSESLMRVLLLLNVSKCEMFVEQNEEWARRKGRLYQFNDNLETNMKLGARTLFLCQKYGVILNEDEYCAISTVDKGEDAGSAYNTPLFAMVNAAKNLTMVRLRQDFLKRRKNETVEL